MRKVNPTALGLFLVVGLAFAVGAVILLSSPTVFHPKQKSILYFDGSLKGLEVGAPVKFRGVTIGKVDQVLIHHNQASEDYSMPVIISIDKTLMQAKSDQRLQLSSQTRLERLIRQGFRGRLDAESLVTGVLYVSLDFVRDAPPPMFHQLTPKYREIPTMPSDVQKLLADLGRLDLPGISMKANALLARLDTSVSQLNVPQINAGVTNLLGQANQLLATPDLTNAVVAARRALDDAEALLGRVNRRVDPLADSVTNTLTDARKTLADLRQDLQNLSAVTGPETSFHSDLTQALEELANASRAVAELAEFLQRNPNALLTGKKPPKEQP